MRTVVFVQGLRRLIEHSKKLFVILSEICLRMSICVIIWNVILNISLTAILTVRVLLCLLFFSSRSVSQAQSPLSSSTKSRSLHHSVLCSFYLTSGHVVGILLDQSVSCAYALEIALRGSPLSFADKREECHRSVFPFHSWCEPGTGHFQ